MLSGLVILLTLHCTTSTYRFVDEFAVQADEPSRIGWLFSAARNKRIARSPLDARKDFDDDNSPKIINGKCRDKLNRLCGDINKNNDELMLLECIQTFKVRGGRVRRRSVDGVQ